jgi:hypothetical protein
MQQTVANLQLHHIDIYSALYLFHIALCCDHFHALLMQALTCVFVAVDGY